MYKWILGIIGFYIFRLPGFFIGLFIGHQIDKNSFIKIRNNIKDDLDKDLQNLETQSVKQASKDSVRAIMLIRAYRIRGHLIANLDPLSIQKKEEHPELKPETYGFTKKDFNRKIFLDGVLGLQYADLN